MSSFTFTPTDIPGVQIVDVKAYGDARGYFMETYKAADFAAAGIRDTFVQDNQSGSRRGVLRGLLLLVLTLATILVIVLRVRMALHAYRGEAHVLPVIGQALRRFE